MIALTPGEPAGIGPDLIIQLAQRPLPCKLLIFASLDLLKNRAARLGLPLNLSPKGNISVHDIPLHEPVIPGELNHQNSRYVLDCINTAYQACAQKSCTALVTGPVHKAIIHQVTQDFTGHTGYLAQLAGNIPVMMGFVSSKKILGLATTHIPLHAVPKAITKDLLTQKIKLLHTSLQNYFKIPHPHIGVLGLNPHAGESGLLGSEEIEIITPLLTQLNNQGYHLSGPLAPDTAFVENIASQYDALLALYHDQGLGPFKALSQGQAVNITFGLPIIRTSVDHGTALTLAGTLQGNPSSLLHAIELAHRLAA